MSLQQALSYGQVAAFDESAETLSPAEALISSLAHDWVGDDLADGATGAWVDRNSAAEIWLGGTTGDDLGDEPTVAGGAVTFDGPAILQAAPDLDVAHSLSFGYLMSTTAEPSGRLFCTSNDATTTAGLEVRWRPNRRLDAVMSDGTNFLDSANSASVPSSGWFWLGVTIDPSEITISVDGAAILTADRTAITGDATTAELPGVGSRPNGFNAAGEVVARRFVLDTNAISLADWATIAGA